MQRLEVQDPNGRTHVIKIDEDLLWLHPYLIRSIKFNVPVWRISTIKGYSVPKGLAEAQKAQCCLPVGKRKYVITILKRHQVITGDGKKIKVEDYMDVPEEHLFEVTLNSFAHELAHLVHWDHTADRFIFESRLMVAFSRLAKKEGYKGYKG